MIKKLIGKYNWIQKILKVQEARQVKNSKEVEKKLKNYVKSKVYKRQLD